MAFEGLNHAESLMQIIVILNDNAIGIDQCGALKNYLLLVKNEKIRGKIT
jgi:deoxyxylulose-5-phosphate synthase